MKKTVMSFVVILQIVAVLLGCSPATPQPTQTPLPTNTPIPTPTINPYCDMNDLIAFNDSFSSLWPKWLDQYEVALSTPKISLADQL